MPKRFTSLAVALALGMLGLGAASAAGLAAVARHDGIGAPIPSGALRITGDLRDGGTVAAKGMHWHPGRLPAGDEVLSFEVAYTWQSCGGNGCRAGADSTATPFAAKRYIVGHADTGRKLRVTETAAETVQTSARDFTFRVLRVSRSFTTTAVAGPYPFQPPSSDFINGLPESRTASDSEYFQVDQPHFRHGDGPVTQRYRVDFGSPWRPVPADGVFYTGKLSVGEHRVWVMTRDSLGESGISYGWRVVPLPAPLRCQGTCWYPPHLDSTGHPMRWDWQIGRTFPLQRTGRRAVDFYDIDGFLTTKAEVSAIHTSWQASTLPHPKAACYLDLAWEDYRPDASSMFPAATLGKVYYGYPEERWVDFRQLDALKPMLRERIAMCARKGFDAVELDDIDSFDPRSTTGFDLTAGDAQNYLAYAFNLVHSYGMTALWKNSPELASWGVRYTDGAVLEECYLYKQCGSWHVFTADKTAAQPTGKWVGEAEYGADHFVCNPGQTGSHCQGRRSFATFCRTVYDGPDGFSAVKFDVDLDGKVFYPCPSGT